MAYTTIDKPSDYFESKIWTGNGSSQNISLDFAPNWVWIKQRSSTRFHNLQDTIRGTGLQLFSNTTGADNSDDTNITAFNSDGYSLGAGDNVNKNSSTYVGWSWKAGTSFTNDASSTSVGTLDSVGSVSATAGFSIISFTGTESSNQSVAHGLGAVPELILSKSRAVVDNWMVHHGSFSENDYISLNLTNAKASASSVWSSLPTSTVINIGDNAGVNDDGAMIMYAFRSVQGYSKFSSYIGNGNADGTFVYTGFKPAFVIIKRTDDSSDWVLLDNKRDSFNVVNTKLFSSNSDGDVTSQNACDFVSNGIKFRDSATNAFATSVSGATYIYMAFAENPFVTSTGVPATAR